MVRVVGLQRAAAGGAAAAAVTGAAEGQQRVGESVRTRGSASDQIECIHRLNVESCEAAPQVKDTAAGVVGAGIAAGLQQYAHCCQILTAIQLLNYHCQFPANCPVSVWFGLLVADIVTSACDERRTVN